MQEKTIKKVIVNKLNDWLSTIDNEDLRNRVKDNILVSGGCIASMLTKQEVNDYDVYIKDMNVLLDLAHYYCPNIVLDGRRRDEYLAKRFPDIINGFMPNGEKYVSEAYVRISNLKPDQIKLDITGQGIKKEYTDIEAKPYRVAFLSQNAISLSDDLQIVLRFNGNAEAIHKTFDFVHATNYFTFEEGLVLNKEALTSLITKQLKYQGSLYPLTSIIRMKKFILRGYSINAGEILKIMFQISELNLKDIEVLEEQLIGVDVAYFAILIEAIRNVDPNKLTSEYMAKLIDNIFND